MRRVLLAALGAATLVASVAGYLASPASGDTPLPSLVDLSMTVTSIPSTVSPSGKGVVYRAKVHNPSLLTVNGDVTEDITPNGTITAVPSICTATTATHIECPGLALAPGDTSIDIRVATPVISSGTATVTDTASVTLSPEQLQPVVDQDTQNNTNHADTTVTNTGNSAAYVPVGGTLAYKQSVLTVETAPNGGGGVIVRLGDAAGQSSGCGTSACGTGLQVEYTEGQPSDAYYGTVQIDVSFGAGDPCHGLGAPKCFSLYMRKTVNSVTTVTPVPDCTTPGGTDPTPDGCISEVYKVGTVFHWKVNMTSADPDILPPLKV